VAKHRKKVNPRRRRSVAAPKRNYRRRRMLVANPRRRRVYNPRRRRSNPRRGRRNPAAFGMGGSGLAKAVLGGLVGVAVTKLVPGYLPSSISGSKPLHVVASAATAFLAQFVAKKAGLSPQVSDAILFGGLMQTGSDAITSFLPASFNQLALGNLVPGRFVIPENPLRQVAAPAGAPSRVPVSGLQRAFPTPW